MHPPAPDPAEPTHLRCSCSFPCREVALRTCGVRAPTLRTIRERYGVARIGIFGSVARNEEMPASDIDILAKFREGEETFDSKPDGFSRSAPAGASRPAPDVPELPVLTNRRNSKTSWGEGRISSLPTL